MKAKEFDNNFDSGKSIVRYLDLKHAVRSGQEQRRANVDFPSWMISRLDNEAKRLGVPRQSLIKIGSPRNCREFDLRQDKQDQSAINADRPHLPRHIPSLKMKAPTAALARAGAW